MTLDFRSNLCGVDRNWGTDGAPDVLILPKSHKNVDSESLFFTQSSKKSIIDPVTLDFRFNLCGVDRN